MPQPMHSSSDMKAILSAGVTSMHSLPANTTEYSLIQKIRTQQHCIVIWNEEIYHTQCTINQYYDYQLRLKFYHLWQDRKSTVTIYNTTDQQSVLGHGHPSKCEWVSYMMCLPILTTGQDRLHSCLHRFGLHLSLLTMAIRVSLSCVAIASEATVSYRTESSVWFTTSLQLQNATNKQHKHISEHMHAIRWKLGPVGYQ